MKTSLALGLASVSLLLTVPYATAATGSAITPNSVLDTRAWTLSLTPATGGSLKGAGSYLSGTTATLTATPNSGYFFTGWTGNASGTANPLSILMDGNKTVGAVFEPDLSDTDTDGLSAYLELAVYGTDPALADTDSDGLTDAWEVGRGRFSIIAGTFTWAQARADAIAKGGDLASFPDEHRWNRAMETLGATALDNYTGLWIGASDAAVDGTWTWVNGEAFSFQPWGTGRPSNAEGNTLDYAEVSGGAGAEIGKWYDRSPPTTRDGYMLETGYTTDPNNSDSDSDGLNDGREQAAGTNPLLADTDGDGFDDGFEVSAGFNPTQAASTPDGIALLRVVPGSIPVTVEFRFNAARSVSYRIEASTDLSNWTTIEPAIIGTGGVITRFYNTENIPKRYFRARRN